MRPWNKTTQHLPANHARVQFVVSGRKTWLLGSYEDNCFRSRWAAYTAAEVSLWRKPDADAEPRRPAAHASADNVYWAERLKQSS